MPEAALPAPRDRAVPVIPAAAALALLLTLLLGGGGSPAPLPELALQLALAATAAAVLWTAPAGTFSALPRPVWLVAALCIGLPAAQLIPLPPALWQALPGRAAMADALALVGSAGEWRAWSVDPARTLAALLAALSTMALLVLTAAGAQRAGAWLAPVVTLAAVLTLLVGAAQLAGGPASALRVYGPGSPLLDGLQANRNSTADLLLIGLVAGAQTLRQAVAAGLVPDRRGPVLAVGGAGAALFALGVALTGSRAGIALLAPALAGAALILRPWWRGRGAPTLLLAAALAVAAVGTGSLGRVAQRFDFAGELRPQIWRDGLAAAHAAWPLGTGMGTFATTILASERLEAVRPTLPNRAHNELLELAVEGGAAALLASASVLGLVVRGLRRTGPEAAFAGTALAILALHSLVDYPLRSLALAGLAAACAGLVLGAKERL